MKPNYFVKSILIMLFLGLGIQLKANHVLGGYITYKHDTLDRYDVYYHIYRDCSGETLASSDLKFGLFFGTNGSSTCGSFNITATRISITDVTMISKGDTITCGNNQKFGSQGVEDHLYKYSVDLNDYSATKNLSCPEVSFYAVGPLPYYSGTGQGPPALHLKAVFKYRKDTSSNFRKNSSPIKHFPPRIFVCCNQPQYAAGAGSDTMDFDSIDFKLTPALRSLPNGSISYRSPFTYNYPITPFCIPSISISCKPNINAHPPRGFYMSEEIGDIIYTPTNCSESGTICYKMNEWRLENAKWEWVGYTLVTHKVYVQNDCGYNKSPKIRGWSIPDKFISGQWNHTSVYEALDETFTPHQTTPDTLDVYSSWLPNNAYIKIKDSSAREKEFELWWKPDASFDDKTISIGLGVREQTQHRIATATKGIKIRVVPPKTHYRITAFVDRNNNGTRDNAERLIQNLDLETLDTFGSRLFYKTDSKGFVEIGVAEGQQVIQLPLTSDFFYTSALDSLSFFDKDTIINYELPLHHFPIVKGRVYLDKDRSCYYTPKDEYIPGVHFSSINSKTISKSDGSFELSLDTNYENISVLESADSCSDKKQLNGIKMAIDSIYDCGKIAVHFPLDLETKLGMSLARRGRTFLFKNTVLNNSDSILSKYVGPKLPYLNLNYPKKLIPIVNIYRNLDTSKGIISWDVTDLKRNESQDERGSFYVPPGEFRTGEYLKFEVTLSNGFNDSLQRNHNQTFYHRIVGPYDPNEKTISSKDSIVAGNPIVYTIEFQNYGNDTAFNVVLIDTLDERLEMSSVELLNSSHPAEMSLSRGVLKFNLPNALLTDTTTSEENSKGFVQFTLNSKPTLAKRQQIGNHADIYFDYEKPVRTNTTLATLLPNVQVRMNDSFFCRKSKLHYSYKINNNPADKYFNLYLMNADGTEKNHLKRFRLNYTNKWYEDSLTLADSLASGNYSLEMRMEGLSSGFNERSTLFEVERQEPDFTVNTNFCNGESVLLTYNNGHTGNYLTNLGESETNFIVSHSFLAKTGQSKVFLAAKTAKGCSYKDTAYIQVHSLPIVSYRLTDTICALQHYTLTLSEDQSYSVYQNGNVIYTNSSDSVFSIQNKGKDSLKVFAKMTEGCQDSFSVYPVINPLPDFEAVIPSFICKTDSVAIEFTKISDEQSISHNGQDWPVSSIGETYIKSTDTGSIWINAKTNMGCITSKEYDAPKRTILDPKISLSNNPVCFGDKYNVNLTQVSDANLYLDGTFDGVINGSTTLKNSKAGTQNIYVLAKNEYGCEYMSNQISLINLPAYQVSISRNGDSLKVNGDYTTLKWSLNGIALSQFDGKRSIQAMDSGLYTIAAVNTYSCDAEAEFKVNTLSNSTFRLSSIFKIIPNPNNGVFQIEGLKTFYITDAKGRKVDYVRTENEVRLNQVSPGTYFLHSAGESVAFIVR